MSRFTGFVNDVFSCVRRLFPDEADPLTYFAEGANEEKISSSVQEAAVLTGGRAETFVSVLRGYAESFGIGEDDIVLRRSGHGVGEARYSHGCYPKNVRRWLSGTVSRKRRCRAELVTLVYCWSAGWSEPVSQEEKYVRCRRDLREICAGYVGDDAGELPRLLWRACEAAYKG